MSKHSITAEEAKNRWEQDIYNNENEVDPDSELHWKSLAVGYFIGLGFSPAEAQELICEIEY